MEDWTDKIKGGFNEAKAVVKSGANKAKKTVTSAKDGIHLAKDLKEYAINIKHTMEEAPETAKGIFGSVVDSANNIKNKFKNTDSKDPASQKLSSEFANFCQDLNAAAEKQNVSLMKEVLDKAKNTFDTTKETFKAGKEEYKKHATLIEKIGNFLSNAVSLIKAFPNIKKMQEKWKDFKKSDTELKAELNKDQYKSQNKSASRSR